MRFVLLSLICWITLHASPLLDIYRQQGIEAVQQQLDKQLTEPGYWMQVLKNKDLSLGYFERVNAVLRCDKERSKLSFFKRDSRTAAFKLQNEFDAFTGKIDGDKQREGDLRTPLGVYRLTQKLDKLDPFYGPLAFVTSYPNFFDRIRGKNGSGIWIHGLPDNAERDPYTRGCIAIENGDIKCMDRKLSLNESIVIIADRVSDTLSASTYATLLSELFQWRFNWLYNNLDDYLTFYAQDFVRHDGMTLNRFKTYKSQVFSYNDVKHITFSNINIVPYPSNEEQLYLIWFDEQYRSSRLTFDGEKHLIVRLENGKMRIVAEK